MIAQSFPCDYKGKGGLCCTRISNLGVKIGGQVILEQINLHIHCGEITAIIGPNGAGKSTFLKALIGLIPYTGTLHFLDAKEKRSNHPFMGYVPQSFDFDKTASVSVTDFLIASRYRYPVWFPLSSALHQKSASLLKMVQADHLSNKRLGVLSGGELQKVLLALALDPIPDILLLDEAISGIDQAGKKIFYQLVSDLKKRFDLSILLVSHDLDFIQQAADRVIFMNKSIVYSGSPEEVFANKLTEVFLHSLTGENQ